MADVIDHWKCLAGRLVVDGYRCSCSCGWGFGRGARGQLFPLMFSESIDFLVMERYATLWLQEQGHCGQEPEADVC